MSNTSPKSVALPEVKAFNPISEAPNLSSPQIVEVQPPVNLAPAAEVQSILTPSSVEPLPVIKRGGYTLTVPGAEDMQAPYVESVVSSQGRVASGPLVDHVDGGSHSEANNFKKSAVGLSLVAGVLMLSASVYMVGFGGQSAKQNQVAASDSAAERVESPQTVAGNSLVDHFQGRAPVEAIEGLKPRRVQIETFRLSKPLADKVDVATTGSIRKIPLGSTTRGVGNSDPLSSIVTPRARPETSASLKTSHLSGGSIGKKLQALRDGSRTNPLTIVHIGDSHVSSDSLSRGIRDGLQSTYGDAGRGAVIPANAYRYAHADGVRMVTSGSWSSANSLKVKSGPYGLSGVRVASSSPTATMTLSTKGNAFDWAEVTVLTGPSQGSVKLFAGGQTKTFNAKAANVSSKVVRIEAKGKEVVVSPAGGKTTVLNWATGRESVGVRYVNFGITSATAYLQNRWDPKLVANDMRHLKPDLIVWGYGTNEGFNGNLNMNSYRNQVQKIYTNLSAAAPQADWLFIGPASGLARTGKATGYCGGYRIPAKLGAVRTALKDFANANGRHFWDWSEAMGGACGIDQWAKVSPRLAAGDRIHLTPKGYRKSAESFVNYINRLVEQPQVVAAVDAPAL